MKDNMKVSEEKPAMAVLWSAPEAIGNILQILTQHILCLDFTRTANDTSVLRIYANQSLIVCSSSPDFTLSDCREEGVQHQVRCVELRCDHVGDHELRRQGDNQHLYCIVYCIV